MFLGLQSFPAQAAMEEVRLVGFHHDEFEILPPFFRSHAAEHVAEHLVGVGIVGVGEQEELLSGPAESLEGAGQGGIHQEALAEAFENDALERTVVLSDPLTSSFIASHTNHDVLFTHYIQHEMRTHRELAERYCLTQLPFPPDMRHPEEEHVLVYGAAYDALFTDSDRERVRTQEINLVEGICTEMDRNQRLILKQYDVQYFLWDEKRQPNWVIPRLSISINEVTRGEGWSLWELL